MKQNESDDVFKAVQAHDTACCAKGVDRLKTCFKATQIYTKNKMNQIRFRLSVLEMDRAVFRGCITNQTKELDDAKDRMVCEGRSIGP